MPLLSGVCRFFKCFSRRLLRILFLIGERKKRMSEVLTNLGMLARAASFDEIRAIAIKKVKSVRVSWNL